MTQQQQDQGSTKNDQPQVPVPSRDAVVRPWWRVMARCIGYFLLGVVSLPVLPVVLMVCALGYAFYDLGRNVLHSLTVENL